MTASARSGTSRPSSRCLLHAENTVIPTQVVVYSPKGTNHTVKLLFGTSLYDLKQAEMPPAADLMVRDGLRLFSPAAALVKVPEAFFIRNPIETQVVLASIADASEVLRRLLDGGHSVDSRPARGAFRRIGRPEVADEIVKTMKARRLRRARKRSVSHRADLRRAAPRDGAHCRAHCRRCGNRCARASSRHSRKRRACRRTRTRICEFVDEIYQRDAYHSLSIEGYSVTPR